jgi:hypothetical protein
MFLFDIGRQKLGAGKRFQRPCMTANGVSSIISLFFVYSDLLYWYYLIGSFFGLS